MTKIVEFSVDHPRLVVSLTLVLTFLFAAQLPKIKTDTDPKNMLPITSAVRQYNDQVEGWFALHPDVIVLGIRNEKGIFTGGTLLVRTPMDPSAVTDSIRRAVWSVDPEVAIPRERTLKTIVLSSEATRRFEAFLGTLFETFAVLLAALGLYGVISHFVRQRTHEIGIRVKLGAERPDVLSMVMGQGLKLALVGV